MKFSKQIDYYKVPEWSDYYFDYAYLKRILNIFDIKGYRKKILKKLNKKPGDDESRTESFVGSEHFTLVQDKGLNRDSFRDEKEKAEVEKEHKIEEQEKLVEQEIEKNIIKVEDEEEESIRLTTEELIEKFKNAKPEEKMEYFKKTFIIQVTKVDSFFNKTLTQLKEQKNSLMLKMAKKRENESAEDLKNQFEAKERDELGYATSWRRALSNIYNQTSWLHSFYSINDIAIKKLLIKAEKVFKKNRIPRFDWMKSQIEKNFNIQNKVTELVDLRKELKKIFAKELTNDNLLQASKELDTRLGGGDRLKHRGSIFFNIGIIISSLFFFVILQRIDREKKKSLAPFFPAFSFTFCIIEMFMGVPLNVAILRKFRINYIYIMEIDPSLRLSTTEVLKVGTNMLAVWSVLLLMMTLALSFDLFGSYFALFSVMVNCFLFTYIFFPFHCSYLEYRKGIISILFKNFFPIGKNAVKFRDFLFGDILTSINKPFATMILSFCLLSCKDCKSNNTRGGCDRNSFACLIFLFYPFFIRFTQCLNRYYYTREAWPHIGNTMKYVGGLSNAICAWYYGYAGKSKLSLVLHLVAGFISQGYMFFWDFYMDWNLGRTFRFNFFLRDKIVYPKYWYYYAIISDFILRFFWLLNLIDTPWVNEEWKNFFFAVCEAFRRIQWCIFRIENENTNNPEKYRAILAIPELPLD